VLVQPCLLGFVRIDHAATRRSAHEPSANSSCSSSRAVVPKKEYITGARIKETRERGGAPGPRPGPWRFGIRKLRLEALLEEQGQEAADRRHAREKHRAEPQAAGLPQRLPQRISFPHAVVDEAR